MPASLFSLPTELRLHIYAILLTDPSPLTLYNDDHPHRPALPVYPAILQSCRQIYTEASPVLYHRNLFLIMLCTDQGTTFYEPREKESNWEPLLVREVATEMYNRVELSREGVIEAAALRKMRNVEIVTNRHAVWESVLFGSTFSESGKTLVEALGAIAEQGIGPQFDIQHKGSSLKIIVLRDRNDPSMFDEDKIQGNESGIQWFPEGEHFIETQDARLKKVEECLKIMKTERLFEVWEEVQKPQTRTKGKSWGRWDRVNVTEKAIEMFKMPAT